MLELVPTPPANAFRTLEQISKPQKCFPLNLYFCEDCTHAQLCDVVDPAVLFREYVYVSGVSPAYRRHLEDYAEYVLARFGPRGHSARIVEIGSNDGTFLKFTQARGADVLGIDPAEKISATANESGVPTIVDFFSNELAILLTKRGHTADIVVANHVFAHIDDLSGILNGVTTLLNDDGVFVFEVNYLLDVYRQNLFDTIYHEHVAYHTVRALQPFLQAHGLELIEAHRTDHQGGSLRAVAQRIGADRPKDKSVADRLAEEHEAGLHLKQTFIDWRQRLEFLREEFLVLVRDLRMKGKRLAGFGAPAKCTTLMYYFGVEPGMIEFIVDDNPLKQGLYTPGLDIPVLPPSSIHEKKPDVLVLFAWNFADSIMERQTSYLEQGGTFLIPLPQLRVVPTQSEIFETERTRDVAK